MKQILLFVLVNHLVVVTLSSKSHPVTTFLNAKWYNAPVSLEIAEYLFDENPSLYWEYVEQLNGIQNLLHTNGKHALNSYKHVNSSPIRPI